MMKLAIVVERKKFMPIGLVMENIEDVISICSLA